MRTFYRWLLTVFLSIAACAPSPHPVDPASTRAEAQTKEPGAFAPKAVEPAPVPERSSTGRESPPNGEKNYILPAFEIVAFEVLLNLFNRNYASDHESYESDIHSIKDNLEEGWEFDRDSFDINQIGHPYQGSVYYTIARSSGLNFWESFGYSTAGSVLWEIAGETTKPSVNDQITTSIGGSFLGEALFRTAETFFRTAEHTEGTAPEVSAALTSPAAAINQQAFDREVTPDLDRVRPLVSREAHLGYLRHTNIFNGFDSGPVEQDLAAARFAIEYGLPGKPRYEYAKPFDYFRFDLELTTSGNDNVDHLLIDGLLYGSDFRAGRDLRGIAGLYGNYNYVAPELFRVASTALSLGSTIRWQATDTLRMQGTALAGVGFGAGGTIEATEMGRDYHYGAVPQGQLAIRLVLYNRMAVDLSGQDFFITGSGSDVAGRGNENITRGAAGVTMQIEGPHAITAQFTESRRNAPFSNSPDQRQRVTTAGLLYTYVFGGSAL